MEKQSYRYIKAESIVGDASGIALSDSEFLFLYRFYVLFSPCEDLSAQSKGFKKYAWVGDYDKNGLQDELNTSFNTLSTG
jgi:hypothetical protein